MRFNKTNKFLLGSLIFTILCSGCFKEEENSKPEINSISIEAGEIFPGDTVKVNFDVYDPDGDPIYIGVKNSKGKVVSNPGENPAQFIPPYIEGENTVEFVISDGKVNVDASSEIINVYSYLYDKFDYFDDYWNTSECKVTYRNGQCRITSTNETKDAIYYFDLHRNIEPPYMITMDLTIPDGENSFSNTDKYGLYLNFYNAGGDTTIKALWFRIYPESSVKNWKTSVYEDKGAKSSWVTLDTDALGMSNQVNTTTGSPNRIKLVVGINNELSVYINGQILYNTMSLANNYLSGNNAPKLILEQIGARTSAGSILLDNVFISKKTELSHSNLF